jgi:hypothetical protein
VEDRAGNHRGSAVSPSEGGDRSFDQAEHGQASSAGCVPQPGPAPGPPPGRDNQPDIVDRLSRCLQRVSGHLPQSCGDQLDDLDLDAGDINLADPGP